MNDRVSIREFARRDGCDEKLARRGITEGRLTLGPDRKLDAAAAGTPWRAGNIDRPKRPGLAGADSNAEPVRAVPDETPAQAAKRIAAAAGVVPPYAVSLARKEHYLGLLRELEFKHKSGAMIDLAQAESVMFEEARAVRNAWLNWPTKYGALIAADLGLEADRITEVLTGYVHKQVASLGEPQGTGFDTTT